ncbi:MAG: hypothetical protein AAB340_02085 [Patescibacteria group bacterium]
MPKITVGQMKKQIKSAQQHFKEEDVAEALASKKENKVIEMIAHAATCVLCRRAFMLALASWR